MTLYFGVLVRKSGIIEKRMEGFDRSHADKWFARVSTESWLANFQALQMWEVNFADGKMAMIAEKVTACASA